MQFLNINQLILVRKSKSKEKAQFSFCVKKAEHWEEVIKTDAYIGKNGMTKNKIEGDGKTPSGKFGIGIAFGTHEKIGKLEYKKINENMYWIDDVSSKNYNQLIEKKTIENKLEHGEHLIEYPIEYEYAIEIKINPQNIKGKGSAIFLHCSNNKPTGGCIAIDKKYMREILERIEKDAVIIIQE